jgi:hypothetical protein
MGYKFKNIYYPVIAKGKVTAEILKQCGKMGGTLAGWCTLGIY